MSNSSSEPARGVWLPLTAAQQAQGSPKKQAETFEPPWPGKVLACTGNAGGGKMGWGLVGPCLLFCGTSWWRDVPQGVQQPLSCRQLLSLCALLICSLVLMGCAEKPQC